MKPTNNRIFCIGCNHSKMLFESESKANNFIKFNKDEIAVQSDKVPCRSYYCSFCCGWHVTSADEERVKYIEEKDRKIWEHIYSKRKKKKNKLSQFSNKEMSSILEEIFSLLVRCENSILTANLSEAQKLFNDANDRFSLNEERFNVNSKKYNTVEKCRNRIKKIKAMI